MDLFMNLISSKVPKYLTLNKTSSSAQTVASIDDLLIQIFLCIPLKPLVRLKLVSKHWNFIISDQNFNFLRSQKNPNPAVGLIFIVSLDKPTDGRLFRTLEFNSRWRSETLNSCNGLLLFRRKGIDEPKHIYYIYVCNPTTNKYVMLPKLDKLGYRIYGMSLAFDPSKSPHYKVVCVTDHRSRNYLQVYSSETGCWRKHWEPFSGRVDFSRRGVYWNGAIHWISSGYNAGQSLYFNPDNDQVPRLMPKPPMIPELKPDDPFGLGNYSYFGESCGHLHYINDYNTVMELNVYEMRTDYSEWFVKYRVDCSLIDIDNRSDSTLCALIRGKKDEDSLLVLQSEKRIIRYNIVNKTCETILDAAGTTFYLSRDQPLQYIESLSHV